MGMNNKLPGYYFIKKHVRNKTRFNIKSNILLFSDPRGGSTWFSKCLVTALDKPLIWEPLHVRNVKELKSLNFGWREYVEENSDDPNVKDFFLKLFEGKLTSDWLYQYTSFKHLYFSNSAIFKICRGNQMIPYLINNFEFQYKPIYLVRHPFAVVASQLKQGGWSNVSPQMNVENIKKDPLKSPHEEFLVSLKTKEEVLTANWCLTNKISLDHKFNNKKWITITYEEFIEDTKFTFERLEKEWNKFLDINKIDFNKNSFTSIDNVANSEKQLTKWKSQFSHVQIEKMLKVLNYFKIDLYNKDLFPTKRFNK